jgi:hypothetical protein
MGNPKRRFFSKTSECDALIQNGAFFMELDAAAIMESIGRKGGINPDVIGSISSNRKFALVYKGEIIAQGSRYDKAYQKVLQDIRKVSYSLEKVGETLEEFRIAAFCKRTPKISNKFPKDGFEQLYSIDKNGAFVNKKGGLLMGTYNFVLRSNGKLKIGFRHHLLANAEEVVAAGNLRFSKGKIVGIDNLSGHYRPTIEEAIKYKEIFMNLNHPIKRAFLDVFEIIHNEAGYVTKRIKVKSIEIKK